jgi:hypothetical protein
MMGLDLWFRDDVARLLASTYETMLASSDAIAPLAPEVAQVYHQGFIDALYAVAVAFGVGAPGLGAAERQRMLADRATRSWGPPR